MWSPDHHARHRRLALHAWPVREPEGAAIIGRTRARVRHASGSRRGSALSLRNRARPRPMVVESTAAVHGARRPSARGRLSRLGSGASITQSASGGGTRPRPIAFGMSSLDGIRSRGARRRGATGCEASARRIDLPRIPGIGVPADRLASAGKRRSLGSRKIRPRVKAVRRHLRGDARPLNKFRSFTGLPSHQRNCPCKWPNRFEMSLKFLFHLCKMTWHGPRSDTERSDHAGGSSEPDVKVLDQDSNGTGRPSGRLGQSNHSDPSRTRTSSTSIN